ncbi:AraC family transcriptional regulator [Solimonas fluminis]|uniref:AraC family transcriptional regulator n=1 Tax=Solimonas fluminis TaxID=2086571 RepID=A0A2S5THH8_9GAMM|nr:AraC family transcriptional regulator [Solimonas fluminis]PPE74425.1 AraC family transcriptional regulator [Solimonas fluminis]
METLFLFDKRNYLDCQNTYRGPRNREYYSGDYSIEPGSVIHVRADRKAVGACSIIRLRSKTRLFFRRSWAHIREDATDVTVLWFVKRGRLCVSLPGGESVANAGDFMITKSMTPFSVECQPGENSVHEVLHVIVPTHILRQVLPLDVRPGFCIPAEGRKFGIAQRILGDLFEDPGELKDEVSQLLINTALSVVGEAVKEHQSCSTQRQTMSDKRLNDVLRFIEIHLSDPKLSIAATAKACGISPRYLSLLLKLRGTPFSELVWDKRLKTASQWLVNSRPGEASISEIAYRVGFKSAAHFSRMFKREFKLSPREYRAVGAPRPPVEPQTLVLDGGESRH